MKKLLNGIPMVIYCYIFMLGSLFSWCLLTVSYKSTLLFVATAFVNFILMYILKVVLRRSRENTEIFMQLRTIMFISLFVSGGIFIIVLWNASAISEYYIASICLLWFLFLVRMVNEYIKMQIREREKIKDRIYLLFKKNYLLFALVIFVFILSYEECGYQFKWDGLLYYQSCMNAALSSISSLALFGHISQTYAGLIVLLKYVFNDVGTAMIIGNVLLLGVAIFSYHGTIKLIIPNKKDVFYFGATAILALSSYYLGMVNYFSLDYCLICLFPVVLYFTFKEKWLYQVITAVLFCFTKETAIIIYGGLCVGIVLYDLRNIECKKIKYYIEKVLTTKHYYTMAIPGILWLFVFILLGPWNAGDSSVSVDWTYIINKLKIIYIFQFNWIFLLLISSCLIYAYLYTKKIELNRYIYALMISQIFFTIFSCLFRTVNHPRYIDSSVVFLYCLGVYCLTKIINDKWQIIICFCLACVLGISSYKSIDIVSNCMFEQIDIGEENLLLTQREPFGDGAIYNKQMLWMEGAMNYAIADAIEDDNIIVVPAIADYTYAFDGASELVNTNGKYHVQYQYWNPSKNRREVVDSENNEEYLIYHISDRTNIDIIPNADEKNISFLYVDSELNFDFNSVLENANIVEEKKYAYRGWELKRVVIEPMNRNY